MEWINTNERLPGNDYAHDQEYLVVCVLSDDKCCHCQWYDIAVFCGPDQDFCIRGQFIDRDYHTGEEHVRWLRDHEPVSYKVLQWCPIKNGTNES